MAYQGVVAEIPLGPEGLTGSKNLSTVRPTQLLRATNVTFENATIQKMPGTTLYTPSSLATGLTIRGGWDWWPTTGVQRSVIVTSTPNVRKDSGAGTYGTTLATLGSMTGVVPVFVEGGKEAAANNRKLFLFTGVNPVKVLSADGATMSSLASGPADWTGTTHPKTGVVHEGRLWGFKADRGYYSSTADHESFAGAGSGTLSIYPGEGEDIVASFVLGPFIIVGKQPRGIYLIDTTDPSTANWKVRRVTQEIGLASPLAYCHVDSDVVIADGSFMLYLLSSLSELADVRARSIFTQSDLEPFIHETTNRSQYGKVQAIYYSDKRRAEIAVAAAGSTINNRRLLVDFNRQEFIRFKLSDMVTAESLWLRKDTNTIPRPVAGDHVGKIRLLDQANVTVDSAGYEGSFQTPHTDLAYIEPRLAAKRKNGQFLELVFEPKGGWDLNVDIVWDGGIIQTVNFDMGGSQAILGTSTILDTDFVLGGDSVVTSRRRIVGGGRRFSMIGRNNGAGQDFSVAKAYLHFTPGDER